MGTTTGKTRDDFSPKVKQALAERVNYHCSLCDAPTLGPKKGTADKRFSLGKAAHIKAAARGGPRYDENQTPGERSAIENGIWACATCADLIDRDPDSYEPAELLRIKADAEWQASARAGRPPGSHVPALQTPSAIQRAISLFCSQEAVRQERLDPRFDVAVSMGATGPVYELRPKEPVDARLVIRTGGHRREFDELREFMDYGGNLVLEGLEVRMEGSPLFLSGDVVTTRLHASSHPRTLMMTVVLNAAAEMPLYLEFSGQVTHGGKGFRFIGSTMGGMLTLTVAADYSMKSPDFKLNFNLEAWGKKPVRQLPHFSRLQQILEMMSKAVPVEVQCTYEGIESDFSSGVIDGSEQFRVLRAFMDEVSNLRKLDGFFDLNLSMPADLGDVLRDQGDISQLLAIIDIGKAEDPTIEINLVPTEPAEELREIIANQRPVAMRLNQPQLNITVFGRDFGPFEIDVTCPTVVVRTVGPAVVEAGVPIQLSLGASEGNSWSARVADRQ
ncbi:hypothetical protein [Burkholderia sp. BCC1999]|uniref:hypothetical protein n=1 Tax=Burkholderia sp. BCC1999 TaxID=2817448 RepID=UPI002AC3196D|nr:hypothetical protein [Burkholderia sp. BCC1999]